MLVFTFGPIFSKKSDYLQGCKSVTYSPSLSLLWFWTKQFVLLVCWKSVLSIKLEEHNLSKKRQCSQHRHICKLWPSPSFWRLSITAHWLLTDGSHAWKSGALHELLVSCWQLTSCRPTLFRSDNEWDWLMWSGLWKVYNILFGQIYAQIVSSLRHGSLVKGHRCCYQGDKIPKNQNWPLLPIQ